MNKINDYIYRPEELNNINLYDFVALFDVKYISKKDNADIMKFLDEHPQSAFRGVINRTNEITPLVSYLDFPDSAEFDGNILDRSLKPTRATERYAKSALCLFVPFRDLGLFTATEMAISYTEQLRTAWEDGLINEATERRLQNIQDCRNMMKSGRQKDMLERTTEPLPDPIKGRKGNDDKTDEEVETYIDACLTELVSQLDEDNNLGNGSYHGVDKFLFMTLTDLRGNGSDQCGYTCITPPMVDGTNCVYEFESDVTIHRANTPNESNSAIVTFSPKIVSKGRLTQLAIQSIKRNVIEITELSHINPNGTVASIQEWARIAFQDRTTSVIDRTQQRAFEVITSAFINTFHDEADQNLETTGTVEPYSRHSYVRLRAQLKKLAGIRNERQLIMFLTGAGGSSE
jgi:hypothetical protein